MWSATETCAHTHTLIPESVTVLVWEPKPKQKGVGGDVLSLETCTLSSITSNGTKSAASEYRTLLASQHMKTRALIFTKQYSAWLFLLKKRRPPPPKKNTTQQLKTKTHIKNKKELKKAIKRNTQQPYFLLFETRMCGEKTELNKTLVYSFTDGTLGVTWYTQLYINQMHSTGWQDWVWDLFTYYLNCSKTGKRKP